MHPAPLTTDEQAALPDIRPRWLAHLAALLGASVGVGALLLMLQVVDRLDPIVTGWNLPWALAGLLLGATLIAPWVVIAPVLFRVGYGWGTVLLLAFFPLAVPFVGWALGFRLVRIPYRDWRPSRRQRPTIRPVPGTSYHLLQTDLDRLLRARHVEHDSLV